MSRQAVVVFSSLLLAGLLAHASASHAQVEDLVSFGTFADTQELQTRLGGVEVYEIICDQSDDVCEDNLGNLWGFGVNLPDTLGLHLLTKGTKSSLRTNRLRTIAEKMSRTVEIGANRSLLAPSTLDHSSV